MLTLHVLNVGHGSSIVVEYSDGREKAFGVIDSNADAGEQPRALKKLRELGASRLSFVALTHPHKDHFSGLFDVVKEYRGSIDYLFSCPFGDLLNQKKRFDQFVEGLQKIYSESDGPTQRKAALELLQLLVWADTDHNSKRLQWHECKGESTELAIPGFGGVDIFTVLPPSRVIGSYVQKIEKADMSVFGRQDDNAISLAFQFIYRGRTVLLGGDGNAANWKHRRRFEEIKQRPLSGEVVNLPHHGSRHDNPPDVLQQLFAASGERFGVTSADGRSHPSEEVIDWMEKIRSNPTAQACWVNAVRTPKYCCR